ncbi:tRNA pseudouridine(55) synthase TruB [Bacillus paralicheniformis]|uniref:tRNA pseudouridine(55) synthase TruB n=1 Tax=Bacillus paralicheniformis TaxID=1648923 RepID=UPI002DBD684B|nr:tRNA pseudouridine(55) synthase TruB [Bacillus paralicheniformis]MEC1021624.1 tRNA pseudouridine(55) synthase TruB [Bacillus paralicheniformis]MEC1024997.1 tRNA pseudouridine(55) synthase TruB [Bacillus paralicheniformis]MEC1033072.1 tRNA pseudouridine(55) synthase TruB [Bacillus paralicheniformis]MEC1051904.1 tRNA pseudouridine(55) synthase TruB [Bacillus paralicheniformis]MEC1061231.1 tRNA pseudouridine(55) synthase TruB [Bacillus paralicheniformis]
MYNGVLLLHKPVGMTSHDCVMKIRKLLKTKKVGHTGTLDPEVSGVLPICVGRATKIVEYLTEKSKTYDAEVTLGCSTETEDQTGEVTEKKPVLAPPDEQTVQSVLRSLEGTIEQVPPMYSAVKVGGKKLYEYARAGIEVERPKRTITIHHIELTSEIRHEGDKARFRFVVTCSKGTYVRTLAVTIGEKLGYPAHMSNLVRTASGPFPLDECLTFEDVEGLIADGTLSEKLVPIERALDHLPKWIISDTLAKKVENGAVLETPGSFSHLTSEDRIAVFTEAGRCTAVYYPHPTKTGLLKPAKVLVQKSEQ